MVIVVIVAQEDVHTAYIFVPLLCVIHSGENPRQIFNLLLQRRHIQVGGFLNFWHLPICSYVIFLYTQEKCKGTWCQPQHALWFCLICDDRLQGFKHNLKNAELTALNLKLEQMKGQVPHTVLIRINVYGVKWSEENSNFLCRLCSYFFRKENGKWKLLNYTAAHSQ